MNFEEQARRLREAGRQINFPNMALTQELFAGEQECEPYAGTTVTRDMPYGEHERNRLDTFVPEGITTAQPIVVFIHGGGFVRGEKTMPGSPYFDNVPLSLARSGMIGANMTYRLAPDAPWPAGGDDVAAAVRHLAASAADLGGDPTRIFLLGTSAGAVHAATAIAGDRELEVAGAILLSGLYDFTDPRLAEMLAPYLGGESAGFADKSSLDGLVASRVPLMPVMAELDPPEFEQQTLTLVNRLMERDGHMPPFVRLPGHNHFSSALHINGSDTWLAERIVDFIRNVS